MTRLALDTIWPRLVAAADEMATTLFRTAFSHDVVEVHDMSTGLYDDRGNLIGQTWLGATGHVGVMPVVGKQLVATFPSATIQPGDIFVSNDPWVCNGQTADIFIFTPAFHRGRVIGFSVNTVHHVDIGGRKGSGLSEEVYEEGLLIPLMRLYHAGQPNETLFAILNRNIRFAEKVMGDIRAQIAAGWVGAEALTRIAHEYGLDDLRAVADEIIARSERAMRAGIARLPQGKFTKSMPVEIGGVEEPGLIQLALTISERGILADFAGTSRQVRRPVNSPINYTRAYLALPLKMVCDPELPNNEGTYRPLSIQAPEGCLINPSYPAACFWRLASGMLVSELVFRILAEIAPERVPADSGSMPTWQFYVNGFRRNGEAWALHQHAFGGMGGRPGADGLGAVSFPYNVRNVSVEWSETETPVLFLRRELIVDSGGAGRWRGGLGEELALMVEDSADVAPGAPITLSGSAGRTRYPPEGVAGGGPGTRGWIAVNDEAIQPTSAPDFRFEAGDVVRLKTPGGAGHSPPAERPKAAIEADLRDGYVTKSAGS
ncbi:MAG: hydantoinase B/oxoprolinase family protein [Alphaproteobacteria bacterium]|nr:hydantoinase B/oxoprolinase family protein [Alphaproteobacteria bacterium]